MNQDFKKYSAFLVAVIAVVAGVYFFNNKESKAPTLSDLSVNTQNVATSSAQEKPVTLPAKRAPAPSSPVIVTKDGFYVVSYENLGFNPKNLEISRGRSVRFVNNSHKAMRIGSTDTTAPASQLLSQPKSVGKGGTYDYTFNEAGTYKYANQNNTADAGTIVVK